MRVPVLEVRRYKKTAEQEWSTDYDTYYFTTLDTAEGLEANRDMFRLSLNNHGGRFTSLFEVDDRIRLFIYLDGEASINEYIFDGLIVEIEHNVESSGRTMTIRGANGTQELLSSLILVREANNDKTPVQIIQQIVDQVNNNNQALPGDRRYISTSLQPTKNDGTTFPTNNFIINYKTAYDAIAQFSGDEYTGDGRYIFWIDPSSNTLYWVSKETLQTISPTGILVEGVNIQSLNVQRGVWDIYNSVIIDVGRDAYGNGNHVLQINPTSVISAGSKWKFLDRSQISERLKDLQQEANPTRFPHETGGDGIIRVTSEVPNSFPFDATYKELNSSDQVLSNVWEISDATEYNESIRQWSKVLGRQEAIDFLRNSADVRYKASVVVPGIVGYTVGQLVELTSRTAGLNSYQLRIKEVTHAFTKAGWTVTLTLEEDSE